MGADLEIAEQAPATPRRLQDRVPIDEITQDARQAKPGRAAQAVIGGALFAVGWMLGKSWRVLFFSGAWLASAVKIGWRQAHGKPLTQPALEDVLAENAALRAELSRVQI